MGDAGWMRWGLGQRGWAKGMKCEEVCLIWEWRRVSVGWGFGVKEKAVGGDVRESQT